MSRGEDWVTHPPASSCSHCSTLKNTHKTTHVKTYVCMLSITASKRNAYKEEMKTDGYLSLSHT